MSKRFSSVSRMFKLACSVLCLSQAVSAGDFIVANREAVLQLTAQIQATQFLTHATFGPTKEEIDILATQIRQKGTIQAATDWIDDQIAKTATLHNPLERAMADLDMPTFVMWKREQVGGVDVVPTNYIQTFNSATPPTEVPALVPGAPTPISYDNLTGRGRYRQHAWFTATIGGEDQLRQKTAWALSQIFAVSKAGDGFEEEEAATIVGGQPADRPLRNHHYMGLSSYYDIFTKNAFGPYRDVLGYVTYHPIMGLWLSYRGNVRATSPTAAVQPDENYAREVMQLFTIGLNELNLDGTQQGTPGVPVATYDNADIREYAKIFTGLGYGYTQSGGTYQPANTSLNKYSPYSGASSTSGTPDGTRKMSIPMRMAPVAHDKTAKTLLNGGSRASQTGDHTEATANAEIDYALTGLVGHPTCAPFVCHKLIQRMVKTSPSKSYLGRVVAIWNTPGDIGNMSKVVKAILLDPEAFQPIRIQNLRSPANTFRVTTMGTEDSRVQEPILNYTRFTRYFSPKDANGLPIAKYEEADANQSFTNSTLLANYFMLQQLDSIFDQSPYEAPSVFNFFYANYQPSGPISSYTSPTGRIPNNDLFAPELQILNAITTNTALNFFRDRIVGSNYVQTLQTRSTGYPNTGSSAYENSARETGLATTTRRSNVTYDFVPLQNILLGGTTSNASSGNAANISALVDHLDLYFCGGTLNNNYKTMLKANLATEVGVVGGVGTNVSVAEALSIVKGAMMAIISSPSFLVTE